MIIYVVSDTHFGHQNMYKFTYTDADGIERRVREEFANAEEGDAAMIERWNSVVKPEDHVYHLGDVAMRRPDLERVVPRLNGHKRLILGNHDKEDVNHYRKLGFQKVYGSRRIDDFLLTHIPVHPNSLGESSRPLINVHGHIHKHKEYGPQYRNVSVERINYTPVPLHEL